MHRASWACSRGPFVVCMATLLAEVTGAGHPARCGPPDGRGRVRVGGGCNPLAGGGACLRTTMPPTPVTPVSNQHAIFLILIFPRA